jgi:hypothetical protein
MLFDYKFFYISNSIILHLKMDSIKKGIVKVASTNIKPILTPHVVTFVNAVSVLVIVYSIVNLPPWVKTVLDTAYARFILSFLNLYIQTDNAVMSLVAASIFSLIYEIIAYKQESFTLIEPDTDASPHCVKITKSDLLTVFEEDEEKLKKAMHEAGVPFNLHLNDANAPEIATYMVSSGKDISESCAAKNFKA